MASPTRTGDRHPRDFSPPDRRPPQPLHHRDSRGMRGRSQSPPRQFSPPSAAPQRYGSDRGGYDHRGPGFDHRGSGYPSQRQRGGGYDQRGGERGGGYDQRGGERGGEREFPPRGHSASGSGSRRGDDYYPPSHHSGNNNDYYRQPPPPMRGDYYDHRPHTSRYDDDHAYPVGGGGGGGKRFYDSYSTQSRRPSGDSRSGSPSAPRPSSRPPYAPPSTAVGAESSKTIWIGNLPYEFVTEDVHEMFSSFGPIEKVTVPIDRVTTKNKGFAFIQFQERVDAQAAFDHFLGTTVEGRRIKLDWDVKPPL